VIISWRLIDNIDRTRMPEIRCNAETRSLSSRWWDHRAEHRRVLGANWRSCRLIGEGRLEIKISAVSDDDLRLSLDNQIYRCASNRHKIAAGVITRTADTNKATVVRAISKYRPHTRISCWFGSRATVTAFVYSPLHCLRRVCNVNTCNYVHSMNNVGDADARRDGYPARR